MLIFTNSNTIYIYYLGKVKKKVVEFRESCKIILWDFN